MYYNADLLDLPKIYGGQSLGFIDDVVYGVQGNTAEGNAQKLAVMLKETEEGRKSMVLTNVHYTRNHRQSTKASVNVWQTKIKPSNEAKYLGVIFDQKLQFEAHMQ